METQHQLGASMLALVACGTCTRSAVVGFVAWRARVHQRTTASQPASRERGQSATDASPCRVRLGSRHPCCPLLWLVVSSCAAGAAAQLLDAAAHVSLGVDKRKPTAVTQGCQRQLTRHLRGMHGVAAQGQHMLPSPFVQFADQARARTLAPIACMHEDTTHTARSTAWVCAHRQHISATGWDSRTRRRCRKHGRQDWR